jgi:hypothetical protein
MHYRPETCQGPPIDADQRPACGSTPAPASSAARCTAMTAATCAPQNSVDLDSCRIARRREVAATAALSPTPSGPASTPTSAWSASTSAPSSPHRQPAPSYWSCASPSPTPYPGRHRRCWSAPSTCGSPRSSPPRKRRSSARTLLAGVGPQLSADEASSGETPPREQPPWTRSRRHREENGHRGPDQVRQAAERRLSQSGPPQVTELSADQI